MLAWVVSALPPVPPVAWILIVLVALSALAYNQNTRLVRWLDQIDWLRRWRMRLTIALKPLGITVFLGLLLAAASRLYLRVFNRLFLRYGKPPGESS